MVDPRCFQCPYPDCIDTCPVHRTGRQLRRERLREERPIEYIARSIVASRDVRLHRAWRGMEQAA